MVSRLGKYRACRPVGYSPTHANIASFWSKPRTSFKEEEFPAVNVM